MPKANPDRIQSMRRLARLTVDLFIVGSESFVLDFVVLKSPATALSS
jgi:hypothetical protein